MNWNLDERQRGLLEFTRAAFAIRLASPVLRRRHFFKADGKEGAEKELIWLTPEGKPVTDEYWQNPNNRALGMLIHGEATDEQDDRGRPIKGDTMLLLANPSDTECGFSFPNPGGEGVWVVALDTAHAGARTVKDNKLTLAPYSLVLLRFGSDRRMSLEVEPLHQKSEASQ
jgi:isoamylase